MDPFLMFVWGAAVLMMVQPYLKYRKISEEAKNVKFQSLKIRYPTELEGIDSLDELEASVRNFWNGTLIVLATIISMVYISS